MATAPVFRVALPSGVVWQFQTKKRAVAFDAAAGCSHGNAEKRACVDCGGYVVSRGAS